MGRRRFAGRTAARPPIAARSKTDVASLAELLRREPRICSSCAAGRLALDVKGVLDAVTELAKTVAIHQEMTGCPICWQNQWVVSVET